MKIERSLRNAAREVKDFFNSFRAIEVRHAGEVWTEYKRCPVKVGGIQCFGTLERYEVRVKDVSGKDVTLVGLMCNQLPVHHTISVPSLDTPLR